MLQYETAVVPRVKCDGWLGEQGGHMEMPGHKKQKKFTVPCFSNRQLHVYICFLTLPAFSARARNIAGCFISNESISTISFTEISRKEINLGNSNINQTS